MRKYILLQLLVIALLIKNTFVFSQTNYVDLTISQPNIEECMASDISQTINQENIKVFPNPSKGSFNIRMNEMKLEGKVEIFVYNTHNQIILKNEVLADEIASEHIVDLSDNSSGIYCLIVKYKKQLYSAKVVLK